MTKPTFMMNAAEKAALAKQKENELFRSSFISGAGNAAGGMVVTAVAAVAATVTTTVLGVVIKKGK